MSDTSQYLDPADNPDPFSSGAASAPSNDWAKNLMMFGAAMSQAGSKPGSTFAGSLGAGVQGAMENARTNAQARSQQNLQGSQAGYYGQEASGKLINNAQTLYQLQRQNMLNQSYGLPTMNIPNVPGLSSQTSQQPMQQIGGSQAPPANQTSSQSQMPPQGAALAEYRKQNGLPTPPVDAQRAAMGLPVGSSSPATMPSSTQDNGTSPQPQESAGMAGPTWGSTPGNTRLNPQPQTNSYPAGSSGTPVVVPGLAAANSPAVSGAALQAAQQASAPAAGQSSEPQLTNQQIGRMLMSPNSAQMLSQIKDPQNAQRIVKAGADLGVAVPPFISELASAPAKALSQNVDAREGSIGYNEASGITATGRLAGMTPQGAGFLTPPQVTKNGTSMLPPPDDVKQDPVDKKWPIPEPNPEHPWGLQAGQTLTKVPDWLDQWREKNYPHMADLQTQMSQQAAMDDALSTLKNNNMLTPGTGAETRKGLVDMWNTANRVFGAPEYDSEKAAASATEFMKIAQQNTNASAHEISSKGTNFDIVSASKANPQYTMPYLSGLITNSMNAEAVGRNYNRIQYIDERTQNGVSEAQATAEFEQQQPGDMVVKRAESVVTPITVNNQGGLDRLLPGTRYILPNGKTQYVPIPKGYPFFVPYTNPLVKATRASQSPQADAPVTIAQPPAQLSAQPTAGATQ